MRRRLELLVIRYCDEASIGHLLLVGLLIERRSRRIEGTGGSGSVVIEVVNVAVM